MKNNIFRPTISILSILFPFLFFLLTGCNEEDNRQTATQTLPIIDVKEVAVQSFPSPHPFEVMATVEPLEQADIAARISGNIIKLPVETGQKVKKGELLVQLDDAVPSAALREAKVALAQSERNLARESRLLKKQAATSTSVKTLQESVKIARAKVQQAQTMLQFATIRAPFAGVITEKSASNGDLAMPGRSLLKLENPDRLQVVVNVPEMQLPLLHKDMELGVHIPSIQCNGKGKIVEITPAIDPISHTAPVKLNLQNGKEQSLISGMFARVQLPSLNTNITSLFIAKKALYTYGQIEKVFIAQDDKALLRIVRSGVTINKDGIDMVEILSGLEANEKVLLADKKLHNLQPIRITQ